MHYGTIYRSTAGTVQRGELLGDWGSCTDVIGNRTGDNPLDLQRKESMTPFLNGEYWYKGTLLTKFTTCPLTRTDLPADPKAYWDGLDGTFLSRLQQISLEVTTRTSPSLPHVSVGQSVYELKDLPSLVRTRGMSWLQAIAAGHLSWRFALAPMIGDLKRLLSFRLAALRRFNYLKKLQTKKWVPKKVYIGQDVRVVDGGSQIRQSNGALVTANKTIVYTKNEWVSTSWKLLNSVEFPETDLQTWHKANRLCAGVTSFEVLQAVWELTPWSWLVDWYHPVSDLLATWNNAVPAVQSGCCYMRTSTSRTTYSNYSKPAWLEITGLESGDFQSVTRKERYVFTPTVAYLLPPELPILTGRQLSILLDLAILKWPDFALPKISRRRKKPRRR